MHAERCVMLQVSEQQQADRDGSGRCAEQAAPAEFPVSGAGGLRRDQGVGMRARLLS